MAITIDTGLEWRALGPVEVLVGGALIDLGPPTQRAVFGLLLSRVDQPVALDALTEALWSGNPPASAVISLRTYVSKLRRVLEPGRAPRTPAAVLRTRAPGYLLDSHGVNFDVHRFTEHATTGLEALARADHARALDEFEMALRLWRGQAYADMRDAAWAAPEVARLEELRLSVVEERCAAQLALGHHHGAVAELDMHVRAHPLRERGAQLLILALYRAGRQAEALGALRDVRLRLVAELGVKPGAALQRLEQDILRQAATLEWKPPSGMSTADRPEVSITAHANAALAAEQAGKKSGQRVVSTQVQGFTKIIGRGWELATLRARFTDAQRPDQPLWQVLTGFGGVGKTSLARAYAQRYQDQYQLVWWVRAENPEAVASEFRALLDILAPQYAELTHDPIQAVHAVLANQTGPWLLVIDNIAEPGTLRGLLPAAGTGDVLITSRAGTWPDPRMVLPVQPLNQQHAVELVTSLSGDPDQVTAAQLALELGGLPLALAQAGCYVDHSGLDLAGYLALYRVRRAELHEQGHAPDYPATVATTWQLAFDQLSSPGRALLNLLAWYASDTIPLDRLLTTELGYLTFPEPVTTPLRQLLTDPLRQHQAVTELMAYGLLIRAGPGGSVTMHRLIQAVTVDQLTAENQHSAWTDAAAALLHAACPQWPGTRAAITAWQSLQTHVRAVLEHLPSDQPISLNLRYTLADWSGLIGDFARGRDIAAAVANDAQQVLGPDHQLTLVTRSSHAYWTGKAGDVERARELAAAVADDMIRALGPNDRSTLLARTNLARWTGVAGDVERARELTAAVVTDAQRELGTDDRHTFVPRTDLVRWTGEAGDVEQARQLAAEVVEDTQRLLGPRFRLTLLARSYLVRWTGEAGDAARARELATALVADDEQVLGTEHRHTLLARAQLARWTGETGDLVSAHKLATTLIEDLVRIYGPDHQTTRSTELELARWTDQDILTNPPETTAERR